MKRTANPNRRVTKKPAGAQGGSASGCKIHPVIIYPFKPVGHYDDLKALYSLVERLSADRERYARPITVVDRKTFYAQQNAAPFLAFRERTVARCSEIMDSWSADTCQM